MAVIFHNMPPRSDTIGSAHGLDTPETVFRVVRALENQGLRTAYSFSSGAEIIARIRAAVTNDNRWLSPEAALERAEATVPAEQYRGWFDRLNPETRAQMEESWGPAPGTVMVSGSQIVIPGIRNGSLFVGVQPMRSAPERAEELYHSTDSTPPHSYLAFYRWVDEVFGADVVLHVGTHGTLEWLPGKEIGLSSGCFGDICIGGMPHLYIYNISILGGDAGQAPLLRLHTRPPDPSMDDADTYGGLTDLDEAIDGYYHARQARPAQVPALLERIFTLAEELEVTTDLQLERADLEAEPEEGVARLHRWVSRIKTSLVRDGLHIYGQPPEGSASTTWPEPWCGYQTAPCPPWRTAYCWPRGGRPRSCGPRRSGSYPDGRTALRIVDGAIATARRLLARLSAEGLPAGGCGGAPGGGGLSGRHHPLARVLDFVCTQAAPPAAPNHGRAGSAAGGGGGALCPALPGGSPSRGMSTSCPRAGTFTPSTPPPYPAGRHGRWDRRWRSRRSTPTGPRGGNPGRRVWRSWSTPTSA